MIGLDSNYDKSSFSQSHRKHFEFQSKINGERSSMQQNFKVQDIQNLLMIEIKKAKQLTQRIQHQIKKSKKQTQNKQLEKLRQIEEAIRRKNITIKQLQNQVNCLKNGGIKPKVKVKNLGYNLSQQMRNNMVAIVELSKQLNQKKKLLAYRKQQAHQMYQKYTAKCKTQQKQIINFIKFKQMQEKRRKQFMKLDKYRNNSKRQISSIWQDRRQQLNSNNQKNQNRIKQTLNYKLVAQAALKNQRKKHKQQMNNFLSKLEFLKDEEQMFQSKIRAKQSELRNAEKRFTESRNRPEGILILRKTEKLKTMN